MDIAEQNIEHRVALYLLYTRVTDLEMRQSICGDIDVEGDKLKALYALINDVLSTKRCLTQEEIDYHKLKKYMQGCDQ